MSRALAAAALSLYLSQLFAQEWDHVAAFSLKKDSRQKVEIHEGVRVHNLDFLWTLYKNGALIMHVNYDKRTFQPVLYAKYGLDTFKVGLFAKAANRSKAGMERPFALIIFKAFDEKKKRAYLDLKIKDYGMSEIFYKEGKK